MSSGPVKRSELFEAVRRELRDFSDQDVFFSQALADRLGLTLTDLKCLSILERSGAVTAGRLAELTGLTSGAITGLIDRLEKGGWARRVRDPNDRRHVFIEVTPRNDSAFDEVAGSSRDALEALISRYTSEQMEAILDFLHRGAELMRDETVKLRAEAGARAASAPGELSLPLGALTSARLKFVSGATHLTLRGEPSMTDLLSAHFQGRPPTVKEEAGTVSIQYHRFSLLDWRKLGADIVLNGSIPWQLEMKGGVSKLDANLAELRLQSLEITSGVSQVVVALPLPVGHVPIRIIGGASDVTFTIPAKASARLQVKGGASALTFNEQQLGAIGGPTSLETPDFKSAADRFDFELTGGASNLVVKSR